MKKFSSNSLEDTKSIAKNILEHHSSIITGHDRSKSATTIGLSGHLGAGKTAFVKEAAKILGIEEEVTSPTFVIMKSYPIVGHAWKKMVHIDAYRLESGKEMETIGFEKLVADPDNLIFIEWPENIKEAMTGLSNYSRVTFSISSDKGDRSVIFEQDVSSAP